MLRDFTPHFIVSYNLGSQHCFPKCLGISQHCYQQKLQISFLLLIIWKTVHRPSVEVISNSQKKDIASLGYLSGYCFRTVYVRLRSSLKHTSLHSQQCMSVLQAGKCRSDADMPVQMLVDARDRGGL